MNQVNVKADDSRREELDRLVELADDILRRCARHGASQAEVSISSDRGLSTTVRLGEVETIEHQRDRGVGITVYFGQRKGSASTADLDPKSVETSIEQACAIARFTEPDPAAGLGDPARMAREFPDLDLWHPWPLDAGHAVELARACEAAGMGVDPRISNSDGASVQTGESLGVYANSHGFIGPERTTRHSVSCVLVAGDDAGMQRDYWYDSTRARDDLTDPAVIGRRAAERTVARLGARALTTRSCPVMFAPELARGLIGHFVGAVSGGALYRKASFLLDHLGKPVFADGIDIVERPFLLRGHASATFDGDGIATADSDLVRDGVLQRYVLGSYSARKLGMESTANAGGIHNLVVTAREPGGDFERMLDRLGTGLLVTELMGQGVNTVTGDYSRGAAGFWVENGVIAYPVEEITIAGNLRDMYRRIVAIGSDVDPRSHILTGSILIGRMTVAGG
ncbi:metalloprotease PmbA [Pseudofulvimonas gallinarii]|uniref:Microcin-processing peptidase 1 n=1 Tax=Pseudofulvimonas gallinarii TaxID=634155 RepID=A0A4V3UU32_9GAMM|nr:metalloprotease PmbA [Pseudofulvimonas gallinarii]TCS98557.1 microcin-processing peptidase 1 [Pseudofulvimonas gallinarii]THD12961.1 metalloprotease PmbA [Pseudofulvimonas gallinarii]